MTYQSKSCRTIPGVLTHFIDDLGITRGELAQMLQISVRTLYNIEYGRKPVERQLLQRLANALNLLSLRSTEPRDRVGLTADNFIRHPDASANVVLQCILQNSSSPLYIGDRPLAAPALRWRAPGKAETLAFAGEYCGTEITKMFGAFYNDLIPVTFNGVDILKDATNERAVIRTLCQIRHRRSGNIMPLKVFFEIELLGDQIGLVDSTCDTQLLAEFIASGTRPRNCRKSCS